jgi:hypothetical protein
MLETLTEFAVWIVRLVGDLR